MSAIFDKLQVYGLSRDDECVILSSLLTGESCLLIAPPGASKTTLIRKIGRAIRAKTQIMNAAFGQFEDIVGFVDMKKLGEGKVDYVETPVSIWNKELVLVDEVNRTEPMMANKWLDFLGDRSMLGRETGCLWLFGACNLYGTEGVNLMGEATVGRFTSFVFMPSLRNMSGGDRRAVIETITGKNLPAVEVWSSASETELVDTTPYEEVGRDLHEVLGQAIDHFINLTHSASGLTRFLDKLVTSLAQTKGAQTDPSLVLDGRRIGMIRRLILGIRAVELARSNWLGITPKSMQECARVGVRYGIPVGVNKEGGRTKDDMAEIEHVVELLLPTLLDDKKAASLELHYELLTTTDIFRKAKILIQERKHLDEITASAAWSKIVDTRGFDASLVGFVANQVEAIVPGTVPPTVLDRLTSLMKSDLIVPKKVLVPPAFLDVRPEIQEMLDEGTLVDRLVTAHEVAEHFNKICDQDVKPQEELVTLRTKVMEQRKRSRSFGDVVQEIFDSCK